MASHLHKEPETLDYNLSVHTPLGEVLFMNKVYRNCQIGIDATMLYTNLILTSMNLISYLVCIGYPDIMLRLIVILRKLF